MQNANIERLLVVTTYVMLLFQTLKNLI